MEIITDDEIYFLSNFKDIKYFKLYDRDYGNTKYMLMISFINENDIYLSFKSKVERDYYYNLIKNKFLNCFEGEIENEK